MALIIGLTGGIASGKSTVSNMIRELDIPVIDADQVAREVMMYGEEAYNKVVDTFGNGILHSDLTINREKLGDIIFHNSDKRKVLNEIVHPAIRQRMNEKKDKYVKLGYNTIVMDVPLLFEGKLSHLYDKILLVYVEEDTQQIRLMERNHLSEEEAKARINSQMPLRNKIEKSDKVINNNGTKEESNKQLMQILREWEVL